MLHHPVVYAIVHPKLQAGLPDILHLKYKQAAPWSLGGLNLLHNSHQSMIIFEFHIPENQLAGQAKNPDLRLIFTQKTDDLKH